MRDKIIITCAVTGNLTTRAHTPHLPVTPAEIAASALAAGRGRCRHRPHPCPAPRDRGAVDGARLLP